MLSLQREGEEYSLQVRTRSQANNKQHYVSVCGDTNDDNFVSCWNAFSCWNAQLSSRRNGADRSRQAAALERDGK